MNLRRSLSWLCFTAMMVTVLAGSLYAADSAFEQGLAQYKAENYEEAVPLFEKAYKENPNDYRTVLYLGLTRRQMEDYPEAVRYFKEALKLNPKAPDLTYLLADVLYGMGSYQEALGYADEAIREGVRPAQSAFLKGLILAKLKRGKEAIEAFGKAKAIDPSMAQQSDFQTAVLYVHDRDYKKAKKLFQGLITANPTSDWAQFSKDYLKALDKVPPRFRATVGFGYQYDDNVLATPTVQGLVPVNRQADWKRVYSLFGEYTLYMQGPWNVKASYALNIGQYNRKNYPTTNGGTPVFSQDTISHTISVMPTYNTAKSVLGLLLSYNYLSVDYTKYLESYTINPSYTLVMGGNNIGQVFVRYRRDDQTQHFFEKKFGVSLESAENRSADNYGGGLGYFYTFLQGNGLVSLKAEYDYNDADGSNWVYNGEKVSAGLLYPLFGNTLKNKLKANLYGELYNQDYSHVHTTYLVKRRDDNYTGQASLTYTVLKPVDVSVGYAYIKDDSNIGVFDYRKNLYTMSVEYKF